MCGIFCAFGGQESEQLLLDLHKSCESYLRRRGPDYHSVHTTAVLNGDRQINFLFSGSVLWLQGQELVKQPVVREKSVFLFNGDVFRGLKEPDRKMFGDTELILNELEKTGNISGTLSSINGPYAFIYYDKDNLKLYFGCDIYGRRSLLLGRKDSIMAISSVAQKETSIDFMELPAIGTFCIDLKLKDVSVYPWSFKHPNFHTKLTKMEEALCMKITVIKDIPMRKTRFKQPSDDDLKIFKEIEYLSENDSPQSPFDILLGNEKFAKNVRILNNRLEKAVEIRISNQPNFCQKCIIWQQRCEHATIGILFSGGVDCTILAYLTDKYYDPNRPIDLINVAFYKGEGYNTPDRETGKETLKELQKLCPQRKWNFVEVNVSQEELNNERNTHIKHIIYPLNRILDDGLGCALWFAARGIGEDYSTSCRVLLAGLGADELFGGYTRQRAQMKSLGLQGLHDSLNEDWQNISQRNLARDDRVVSDHGSQLRIPYLDEGVVKFVQKLECWEKTYPSNKLPQGLGEKILLRTLAYTLGLKGASLLKKRALQFGSRIAYKKENAFHVSPRLI